MKFDLKKNKKQKNKTKLIPTEAMGFCEFQAVKFSQSREIYRCTRKRQGCTRIRHTSGREVLRLIDPFDFAPAHTSHSGFIGHVVFTLASLALA